jgi:hypothetical protein
MELEGECYLCVGWYCHGLALLHHHIHLYHDCVGSSGEAREGERLSRRSVGVLLGCDCPSPLQHVYVDRGSRASVHSSRDRIGTYRPHC